MPPNLTTVLRGLLDDPPITLRALGRLAGLSHSTLSLIRSGHLEATPEVAGRVAEALERHGRVTTTAAHQLQSALKRVG